MRSIQLIAICFPALALAACGVGQSQDPDFIRPGEWEITNGYPGREVTFERCLTKEDIAKPELGALNMDNPGCNKDRFTVSGGKIKFALACAAPGEAKDGIRMTGEGKYDSKSFDIKIHRAKDEDGRDAAIRGKWIGECQDDGQY